MTSSDRLATANFGVAIGAFGVAAAMAVMQALSRANLSLPYRSPDMYYLSVTAHGVLMALVFTTFFIMGLGYVLATRALERPLPLLGLAWASFWVAVAGTMAAAWAILSGKATVLYTFYPPLQAHPAFYIGLTLVVVGSWGWCLVMLRALAHWRRDNPGRLVPLAMHGMVTTTIVWLLGTIGVAAEMLFQLIPWSLHLTPRIDPLLARMLFWWFGHPLVYFWVLPAYVIWYTILPRAAGGKLFSDPLGRLVFILFIVLSTPVGFHHEFMDPGIPAGWKALHTFNTYLILYPSFITAFTVIASLELAGRARGGTGVLRWIRKLPWADPLVAAAVCSMLLFAVGGFGGAINASFAMNAMVHNTSWITGHFHTTVGSAVALTFMGMSYWLLPRLIGRRLKLVWLARIQPWLWLTGMTLFAISMHITGMLGMPRRIFDATYQGNATAATWAAWTDLSAVGGVVLFVSALCFLLVVLFTVLGKREEPLAVEFAEPLEEPSRAVAVLDHFGWWTVLAAVMILIAYAYPLIQHLRMGAPGSPPFPVY